MPYATPTDLVEYQTGTRPTEPVQDPAKAVLLRNASVVVDKILRTAIYPVDTAGQPTQAAHIVALRDATCAQAAHFLETGDSTGAGAQFTSVSMGAFSGSLATAGDASRFSAVAVDILANAGLTGHPVQ